MSRSGGMDRGRWIGLEAADTGVYRRQRQRRPYRRAALEEALFDAYASGDREGVSRLGVELAHLVAEGSA